MLKLLYRELLWPLFSPSSKNEEIKKKIHSKKISCIFPKKDCYISGNGTF